MSSLGTEEEDTNLERWELSTTPRNYSKRRICGDVLFLDEEEMRDHKEALFERWQVDTQDQEEYRLW